MSTPRFESISNIKRVWFILDEIAVAHSATHTGSKNAPCPICDRAVEGMGLLPDKPDHVESQCLYIERNK